MKDAMKKGQLYVLYAFDGGAAAMQALNEPADSVGGPVVLELVLPENVREARPVVRDKIPLLVTHEEPGRAYIIRVEDWIDFRATLAPVKGPQGPQEAETPLFPANPPPAAIVFGGADPDAKAAVLPVGRDLDLDGEPE